MNGYGRKFGIGEINIRFYLDIFKAENRKFCFIIILAVLADVLNLLKGRCFLLL